LGEDEKQIAGSKRQGDDKLAKDVARLYSWASVDDAPYRDFFRLRKQQNKPQVEQKAQDKPEDTLQQIPTIEASASGESATVELGQLSPSKPTVPPLPPAAPAISPTPVPSESSEAESHRSRSRDPQYREPVIEPSYGILPASILAEERQTAEPERHETLASGPSEFRPAMAIYSLAGGVGKTTLCANLGRALYSITDRVLLVDASGSGLLPFYFGANNLRPGLHTFADPDVDRAPLRVCSAGDLTREWLNQEVRARMAAAYWTIFDLGSASMMLLPQILEMCAFVLIPLLPDLNSILSVSRIESMIESMRMRGAAVPSPFYLFNKFDPEDPIDEGARELVLRQCGGRLLPWSIGYDSEAARAIALRKTVIDHAPDSELAQATLKLAALLQQTVASNHATRTGRRWNDV
jgi:cellulose biosynthesis protein BcsQ